MHRIVEVDRAARLGQPDLNPETPATMPTRGVNWSPENARSYSPMTTASNLRSMDGSSASSADASRRDDQGSRREQPASKNSAMIVPWPMITLSAASICHPCDDAGS